MASSEIGLKVERRSRIRVLHVVLDMDLGGLQRVVHLLLQRCNSEVFELFLCALDRGGVFYDKEADVSRWILDRRPGPFDVRVFTRLLQIVRRQHIDIIHSHNGCGLYAVLVGWITDVKGIVHSDHGRLVPDRRSTILEDHVTSYFMNYFVGVSEDLTRYLEQVVRVAPQKLLTIVNGIDTFRFVPGSPEQRIQARKRFGLESIHKVIGTVCRLDRIKNLEFLVERMAKLSEQVPHCRLVIVGDGPDGERLRGCVSSYGLTDVIMLPGRFEDIENVMPAFDIYVCSSLSEGTSMTILEAMACSLPVVATDVGGNGRLVDASSGILYPLNDAMAFDVAMLQLLGNPPLRTELGRSGRKRVLSNFSLDQTVKRYEDLYLSLVAS